MALPVRLRLQDHYNHRTAAGRLQEKLRLPKPSSSERLGGQGGRTALLALRLQVRKGNRCKPGKSEERAHHELRTQSHAADCKAFC